MQIIHTNFVRLISFFPQENNSHIALCPFTKIRPFYWMLMSVYSSHQDRATQYFRSNFKQSQAQQHLQNLVHNEIIFGALTSNLCPWQDLEDFNQGTVFEFWNFEMSLEEWLVAQMMKCLFFTTTNFGYSRWQNITKPLKKTVAKTYSAIFPTVYVCHNIVRHKKNLCFLRK